MRKLNNAVMNIYNNLYVGSLPLVLGVVVVAISSISKSHFILWMVGVILVVIGLYQLGWLRKYGKINCQINPETTSKTTTDDEEICFTLSDGERALIVPLKTIVSCMLAAELLELVPPIEPQSKEKLKDQFNIDSELLNNINPNYDYFHIEIDPLIEKNKQ